MSARFKFGDIIENGWAADENPRKRGVYLWSFTRSGRMNPGKHVKLRYEDGKTGELRISDDDKMTVVGTIFDKKVAEAVAGKNAEIAALREEMRLTSGSVKSEISSIVQTVNDWDDRTSPDDYPDHLLITSDELTEILTNFAVALKGDAADPHADAKAYLASQPDRAPTQTEIVDDESCGGFV